MRYRVTFMNKSEHFIRSFLRKSYSQIPNKPFPPNLPVAPPLQRKTTRIASLFQVPLVFRYLKNGMENFGDFGDYPVRMTGKNCR